MTAMYQSSFIKNFVLAVNIRYLMDKPIVLRLLEDVKSLLHALSGFSARTLMCSGVGSLR